MDSIIEQTLNSLVDTYTKCTNNKLNEDSYTSPSFAEFLKRPLRLSDIPGQSYDSTDKRSIRREPNAISWEDSIKNFVFDTTSFDNTFVTAKQRFEVCIMLTEPEYKLADGTSGILVHKYLNPGGVLISVTPNIQGMNIDSFTIVLRTNNEYINTPYIWTVLPNGLIGSLEVWYRKNNTLIYCHDNSIDEYLAIISNMPESIWSVSCTPSVFIQCKNPASQTIYICSVYSCAGSMETRAIGSGEIKIIRHKVPGSYEGRLSYYQRSVRGSSHSSGRCYDCQVLYKTIMSIYKSPLSSPSTPKNIKFADAFLDSTKEL